MAFSTWESLRTEILDRLQEYVAGEPFIGEFEMGDRRFKYNGPEQLTNLYQLTFKLESAEAAVTNGGLVSYARARRFS